MRRREKSRLYRDSNSELSFLKAVASPYTDGAIPAHYDNKLKVRRFIIMNNYRYLLLLYSFGNSCRLIYKYRCAKHYEVFVRKSIWADRENKEGPTFDWRAITAQNHEVHCNGQLLIGEPSTFKNVYKFIFVRIVLTNAESCLSSTCVPIHVACLRTQEALSVIPFHSASWVQLRSYLEEKSGCSGLESHTAVGIRHAVHVVPSIRKSWH
jgi:hypothetical protein